MTDTQTATEVTAEVAPPTQLPAVPDKHAAAVEKRQRKPLPATGLRNIATALAAVTAEVGVVAKQGYNKFHNYKYAAMGDVLQKLTPLIGKHGLIIVQTEVENGRKMLDDGRAVAVEYEFTIAHSSGEMWPDRPRQTGLCRCRDSKGGFDDKCFNKTHTAARKYFLLSLFQVATGEEDDADPLQTGNAARKPPAPAANIMTRPITERDLREDYDPDTGEITEPAAATSRVATTSPAAAVASPSAPDDGGGAATISIEAMAREAAQRGREVLRAFYKGLSKDDRKKIDAIKTELEGLIPPDVGTWSDSDGKRMS